MSARAWVVGLTVVVVAGAGFVVTDRVMASRAQTLISDAMVANLDGVDGEPQVDVGGFPFLPQLLRGTIDQVDVTVDGLTLGGIAAEDVVVSAQDATTSEPLTVGAAHIEATLPTASVEQVIADRTGLEIEIAVEGDALRASGSLLGLELSAALVPRVDDGRLLVDLEDVKVAGLTVSVEDLPDLIASRVQDLEIPVDGLPEGLTLSSATVVPDGVRVVADGTDVELPTEVTP